MAWGGVEMLYTTSRTNQLAYSAQFDNAFWIKLACSITANAAVAPDGTLTADYLVANTASSTHPVYNAFIPATNTTYTFSVYLKAGAYSFANVQVVQTANLVAVNNIMVNLSSGTIVSANDMSRSSIQSLGNGWYRVSTTVTTAGILTLDGTIRPAVYPQATQSSTSFAGDGTSGIYIWGAQLEFDSVATSYIQTVTSATSVTDYTISGNAVTFFSPPASPTQLLWSGSGVGESSGIPIAGNYSQFGLGDGVTSTFQITGGTTSGSNLAYGIGGGYGSQLIPYQAFVTAFRPTGSGIPYVAGYSSTPSGYSTPSRGEYASQSMITGSITDAQVYEAVAAVKMEGTIVWVRLQ